MPANSISIEFQIMMWIFAGTFWILGWIPVLNIITNTIYWIIWVIIFFYKYFPLIKSIAKGGASIASLYVQISIINLLALILGWIPIICWIPWQPIANGWTNHLIKKMAQKIKKLKEDAGKLKQGWKEHKAAFRPAGQRPQTPSRVET